MDHMRKGKELVVRIGPMTRQIALSGFNAMVDEFIECAELSANATN
jgi:hypothetical protein